MPVGELQLKPIASLAQVTVKKGEELFAALDIRTIRELALWPPYRSAREIMTYALGGTAGSGEDPERPLDLVPETGRYPTERVQYEVILLDRFHCADADGLTGRGEYRPPARRGRRSSGRQSSTQARSTCRHAG